MENKTNKNNDCEMWCNMIEYDTSCNTVKTSLSNSLLVSLDNPLSFKINIVNPSQGESTQLTIDEILQLDYIGLSELTILKNQSYVTSQLKKYITSCKNEKINFNSFMHMNKLKWLLKTTTFLADKRKLTKIKSKKTQHDTLKRNSYDFCEKNKSCTLHIINKCKKKHFVYNYVQSDVEELINYIENYNTSINEIYVSITTISYVINHMKDELTNLS